MVAGRAVKREVNYFLNETGNGIVVSERECELARRTTVTVAVCACDVCDRRCSVGFGGAPRTLLGRLHIGAPRPPVRGRDGCERERGTRRRARSERASQPPPARSSRLYIHPAGRLTRAHFGIRGGGEMIPWYQPNTTFRRVRVQTVYIRSCQSRGR